MEIKPNETIIESDLDILGSKEEAWKASMRIHYLTDNHLIKKLQQMEDGIYCIKIQLTCVIGN
jgi:hypothetical protein